MQFSEKVKQVRKKLNLSQEDLAKELGIAFSTLNRWENGRFKPSYDAQENFAVFCKKNNITIEN